MGCLSIMSSMILRQAQPLSYLELECRLTLQRYLWWVVEMVEC